MKDLSAKDFLGQRIFNKSNDVQIYIPLKENI